MGQGGGGGWGGGGGGRERTRADNVGKKTVCVRIIYFLRGNFCRFIVLRPGCAPPPLMFLFFFVLCLFMLSLSMYCLRGINLV